MLVFNKLHQAMKLVGGGDDVETCDESEDSEDNDFQAYGLSFDDSEDERALRLDDCFDEDSLNSKRGW